MIHMNLRVSTECFIRIVSIYLVSFWGVLYLGFSLDIEVGLLAFRDMIKAFIMGSFTYMVGCLGHIIGFIYLFKFNLLRRHK